MYQGLIALLLAAFFGVGYLAFAETTPRVEADLRASAVNALQAAGLPTAPLMVDGLDLWVSDRLADPATFSDVRSTLRAVPGVHEVLRREATPVRPTTFGLRRTDTAMVVSGRVPVTGVSERLLERVRSAFGDTADVTVLDSLVPDSAVSGDPWLDSVPALIDLVVPRMLEGSVAIRGRFASFEGSVENEGVRNEVSERLRVMLPGVRIRNQLTVDRGREEVSTALVDILNGRPIRFPPGVTTVTPEIADILDEIGVVLQQFRDVRVRMTGHAEGSSDPQARSRISMNRAQAVQRYLVSLDVEPSRLEIGGGNDEAIAAEGDDRGRVTFEVIRQD